MSTEVDLFLAAQDASPDPFMLFRPVRSESGTVVDLEWQYANPASERLVRRPVERLPGRRLLVETAGTPLQGLFDALSRVIERGVGFRRAAFYPEEGREICLRLTAVRVNDGLALLATDVTAARRAEVALRDAEERFLQAQKMETLGRLVSGVAHDFNNMLSAITLNAHLLLKQLRPGDPSRKYSREIDTIAGHAAALTHQILAYSEKQIPEARVFNLNTVVTDLVSMLRRLVGEEIELRTRLDPELGRIKADAVQMQQILLNLVINARDAIPDGGTIEIETRNVQVGEESAERYPEVPFGSWIALAVRDTGAGISREIQPKLFESDFSTKEHGTGLGLSTVHMIIRRTGGHAFVESEVGEGATFEILLPEALEAASPVERRASPGRAPSGTETILLVEDEEKLRTAMKRTLKRKGYRVLEAKHGEQALSIVRNTDEEIHLLIADLVMPLMGGRILAQELSALRPGIKVLFTSGYADRTPVAGGEAGAEMGDLLMKPFTPYALAGRVRESIDGVAQRTDRAHGPG
jgi:two-component system, cell cycle sensor histidine kinase and response regulator CckA